MPRPRRDPIRLAGSELLLLHLSIDLDRKVHLTGKNVYGLVFSFVILEREQVAGLQVQDLPGVPLGLREDELVSPGLRHPSHDFPRTSRSTSAASAASSA